MWPMSLTLASAVRPSAIATPPATLAVAGIRGGLGRELAYQALQRNHLSVLGLVRANELDADVRVPYRGGWLSTDADAAAALRPMRGEHLSLAALDAPPPAYDGLVLCMSSKPFSADDSADATADILARMPSSCRHVVLVSAHGVGDSIRGANVGIRAMRAWYLRDTYGAKAEQERLVEALQSRVHTTVLRPKVLSYGHVPFNTIYTRRQDLAARILDAMEL